MAKTQSLSGLILIAMFPMISIAQSMPGDQELSASYGRKSGTEILKWFYKTPPNLDHGKYNVKQSTTGNMFLTYRYAVTPVFSLGVTIGTESFSYNNYYNERPNVGPINPQVFIANYKVNVTTFAVETKWMYHNGKRLKMYGLGGFGARLYTQKSTPQQSFDGIGGPVFINTQTTPFGISYGNQLSGFAEIGLGYKGLINGGISYRFSRKQHDVNAK